MPGHSLFSIVLAAGRASRYGSLKQLATHGDSTLVALAVQRAEAVTGRRTILVTGCEGSRVHAACAPLAGYFVHNDRYADGLSSSLAAGVAAVAGTADAVLLLLADQPRITAADLGRLVAEWEKAPEEPLASRYAGRAGVPAIFPRSDFAALMALTGDRGARELLSGYGEALRTVELPAAAFDIDRPADLDAAD